MVQILKSVLWFALLASFADAQILPANHGGTGSASLPTGGQVLVGNGSNAYTPRTIGGDCTMSSVGALSCASGGLYNGSTFRASQNCTTPGTYDETCANNASRAATAIGGGIVLLDVANGATGPQTYTFSHDAYTNACGITSWSTSGTTLTVNYSNTGACTVTTGKLILISGTATGGGGHTIDNGASGNPSTWTVASTGSGTFTASSSIASDSGGSGGVVDTKQPVIWLWQSNVTVNVTHSDAAGHFGICYGEKSWLFGTAPGLAPANSSFTAADLKTSSANVDAIIRPCNQRGLQQGGGYKNFNVLLDGSSSTFLLGSPFPTTEAFTGSENGNMIIAGGGGAANPGGPIPSLYGYSSGTSGVNTTAVVVVDSINGNPHAPVPVTAIVGGSSSGPTDILIKSLDQEHTRSSVWTGVNAALSGSLITFTVTAPNYAYQGGTLVVTGCSDTNYNLTWRGDAPTGATGGVSSVTSTTIVVGKPTGFAGGASTSGCSLEFYAPIFLFDGGNGSTNSVSTAAGINIGRGYFEAETGTNFSRIGFLARNGAHDSNFNNFRFAGGNHFLYDIVVEGPAAPVGLQWHNVFCHLSDTWVYTDFAKTPVQQVPCSPYPHANEFYTSDGNYFQSWMLFGRNSGPTSSMSNGIAMEWSKANDGSIAYRPHLLLNNDGVDYQPALEKATDTHTGNDLIRYGSGGIQQDAGISASGGNLTLSGAALLKTGSTVVGSLPSAASNAFAVIGVTDSTSIASEGQTCVGGSSNKAIAISNGSVWKCF